MKFADKKGIGMLSVVLGMVLLFVLVVIVYNMAFKPSQSVSNCSNFQNAVCDFKQCPAGYIEIFHLKCEGSKKGNSCCVPEESRTGN